MLGGLYLRSLILLISLHYTITSPAYVSFIASYTKIYICVCKISLYNISQPISWISPPNAAPASARTWPWPIPVLGGYPQRKTPEYVVKYGEIPWNPHIITWNPKNYGEIWWNPKKYGQIMFSIILVYSCYLVRPVSIISACIRWQSQFKNHGFGSPTQTGLLWKYGSLKK